MRAEGALFINVRLRFRLVRRGRLGGFASGGGILAKMKGRALAMVPIVGVCVILGAFDPVVKPAQFAGGGVVGDGFDPTHKTAFLVLGKIAGAHLP